MPPAVNANSKFRLLIDPILAPWLKKEVRKATLVMIDIDPDILEGKILYLGMNIIISSVPIRFGKLIRREWYLGCKGVRVVVEIENGIIVETTAERKMPIEYQQIKNRKQKRTCKILPSMNVKKNNTDIDLKGMEIDFEKGNDYTTTCKYNAYESELSCSNYSVGVKWELVLPRAEKAISDFVNGNLYLFSKIFWSDEPREGNISVIPIGCNFFSENRRPLPKIKYLTALFRLIKARKKVHYLDGFKVNFELEETQW